ncbi:MAG: DUF1428 family protein [Ignavibacteria bacterium]|nr:DUF1428 family protein [Ignavibacteria bacterium]
MTTTKAKTTQSKKVKAKYADGFLIAIPAKNIPAYKIMSNAAGKVWKEYGALDYKECIGDDLDIKMAAPFPRILDIKKGEKVIFSWITYKSKKHRDSVNAKVMKDPRIIKSMDVTKCPFDVKRMSYGGFEIIVDMQ